MKKSKAGKGGPPADARLSRRNLLQGAAVGAIVGAASTAAAAETSKPGDAWDYEADIVVLGGGSTGLVAAVRARDLSASVLVLDQNYDLGGKLSHSTGRVSLGGGDAIQERDRQGLDPDNMGLAPPLIAPRDLEDDPDRLFTDMTDWSVVNNGAIPEYRFNDRELHRAWADHAVAVRQFLMDNHVRFARIDGTHYGGGMSRARAARAVMKIAGKTDIEAGTITLADKGAGEKSSPFNPMHYPPGRSATAFGAPGWAFGGFVISRALEYSARKKGVRFMVNRHLDEIVREHPNSGRVIGITASYTPRFHPETKARLESFWSNGNIDERRPVIRVRARKAVIVGTGGHMGNVQFRTMFDPRLSEPSLQDQKGFLGPLAQDASGILAGMKIGAALAGLLQPYGHPIGSPQIRSNLASSAAEEATFPGHPAFLFVRAAGVEIGSGGWEHLIAVNQVGRRFYNETTNQTNVDGPAAFPPGSDGTNNPFTPLDWRNSSVEHVRHAFNRGSMVDAALAMNEGSTAPDYAPGPIWAIFDQAAVDRNGWELRYPYIADPPDGLFHKADTLAELSRAVTGNPFQKMPLKHLEETVARYNGFADAGKDPDFEKPVMHRIDKAPFYAAQIPVVIVDSYGGLRINGKSQVIDFGGKPIAGLYAGGEATGGGRQHGIGRAAVHGYIAADNAVKEPVT